MMRAGSPLAQIEECLPVIMRRLSGGPLIASGAWELTVPQLRALALVAERGNCAMGELARGLAISLSAASGLADRLVEHGLVARASDPDDRRIVRVRVTAAGRRALDACRRERRRRVRAALRALSAVQQAQVAAALGLLYRAVETMEAS